MLELLVDVTTLVVLARNLKGLFTADGELTCCAMVDSATAAAGSESGAVHVVEL